MSRIFINISVTALLIVLASFRCEDDAALNHTSEYNSEPVTGLNLGNVAPEIEMSNPYGEVIPLSSLRGKLVLIDFWASWCGPCRHENPAVVKAYQLYSNKKFRGGNGFTVYGVSLDGKLEAWKRAIEKDNLSWPYHVSDLQGWNSSAATRYDITSIPANFLINEKGIIIKKNLRGEELIEVLENLAVK